MHSVPFACCLQELIHQRRRAGGLEVEVLLSRIVFCQRSQARKSWARHWLSHVAPIGHNHKFIMTSAFPVLGSVLTEARQHLLLSRLAEVLECPSRIRDHCHLDSSNYLKGILVCYTIPVTRVKLQMREVCWWLAYNVNVKQLEEGHLVGGKDSGGHHTTVWGTSKDELGGNPERWLSRQ